ncbi:hypothetical protein [Mesonia sp. K7]|uniref:hypothetical protein n=1 Tax=Mesonia sp. K7 TaxID=2218606 RepID=UPI001314380B|nr:hypothetical protein [Mesonia sp. K7]
MKNTLKLALLLIGFFLIGFGLTKILFSENIIDEANTQNYAMVIVGVLFALVGWAFKKR